MTDIARIKSNVGSMIDQGASEAEIDSYLSSEGTTATALHGDDGKLSADDEAAYASLAANPSTTAADLKGFASTHGMTLRDGDIQAFLKARNSGSRVSKKVIYEGLPKAPPASLAQNVGAFVGRAVDGVIPGVARTDRGVHSVISNAASAIIGDEKFDPAAAFQQGKDEQDYAQARFGVEHDNLSTVADLVGLAGSFALPEARVFRMPTAAAIRAGEATRRAVLVRGMANNAITAGGYGAVSGALNETGEGNLSNATIGGVVGGALGAGGTAAVHGAASLGAAARRTIPGVDMGARFIENLPRHLTGRPLARQGEAAAAQGERILRDELQGATIATGMGTGNVAATPQAIQDEVSRRQGLGVPAVPADVTEPGRRITSWALQGNGPATTRARNLLMGRQAGQGARIRGHITDELGPAVDPIQAARDINQRTSQAAGPGYEAAYAQPLFVTPEMAADMATPAFRNAIPQAFENIQNAKRNPFGMGFREIPDNPNALPSNLQTFRAADGRLIAVDPNSFTFEAMDQITRAMRDSGQAAMNTNGFTPRDTTNSVHINARTNDLRNELRAQNEPYRDVTDMYADAMGVRDALETGSNVKKLSGHEINAQLQDLPQANAREAWTTGARTALADDAVEAGLKPTANVAQRIRQQVGLSGAGLEAAAGDRVKQDAIETMANRPGSIGRLDDRLEAEDQAYKTFHEVAGNSKTQPRQALDEALSGQALNVAAKASTGNFSGAISSLLFQGNPRGAFGFKRDVQERIAELMTAQSPQSVAEAMQAIMHRAQADADFAHALNRAGVKPAKIAAAYLAALDTEAAPEDPEIAGPVYTKP